MGHRKESHHDFRNPQRTKIVYKNGGYYVNRPNFDGGTMVPAEDYDQIAANEKVVLSTAEEMLKRQNELAGEVLSLNFRLDGLQKVTRAARIFVDTFPATDGYPGDGLLYLTQNQYDLLVNLKNAFIP